MTPVAGLVLAAGAGTRYGGPKALARDAGGRPWLELAVEMLQTAGCTPVAVVLGARAAEARALVPLGALLVEAADWQLGLGASLRAGLAALTAAEAPAVLVSLVDLPGMPASVVRRVLAAAAPGVTPGAAPGAAPGAGSADDGGKAGAHRAETPGAAHVATDSLAQAVFGGRPGHPALLGRDHWPALVAALDGDRGARPFLVQNGATQVECGDLWHGRDVDRPEP